MTKYTWLVNTLDILDLTNYLNGIDPAWEVFSILSADDNHVHVVLWREA